MSDQIIRNPFMINAFNDGQQAFLDGKPLLLNPHTRYTGEYSQGQAIDMAHHWDFGWMSAFLTKATSRTYER